MLCVDVYAGYDFYNGQPLYRCEGTGKPQLAAYSGPVCVTPAAAPVPATTAPAPATTAPAPTAPAPTPTATGMTYKIAIHELQLCVCFTWREAVSLSARLGRV